MSEDHLAEHEDELRSQQELAHCLIPLLNEVAEPYREILKMVEIEGVAQTEAASQLGLSVSGAKSRVQRGRKMLLGALLKCCRVDLDRRSGVIDYESREVLLL